ncbi:hypothetical protein [Cryobacterium sp. Y50]|uniref:hypothetical protein n=1 Tax=Cryobacterium sp. Y50 TaxID=2048286 RepID=UPI001304FDCA|nr:hypothetical protein [Cryobacterium sp. Y50]
MTILRYFGWLVPVIVFGIVAIVTPISAWLLGGAALLVVILGYAVAWRRRPARRER